jgi:hypothetical protein
MNLRSSVRRTAFPRNDPITAGGYPNRRGDRFRLGRRARAEGLGPPPELGRRPLSVRLQPVTGYGDSSPLSRRPNLTAWGRKRVPTQMPTHHRRPGKNRSLVPGAVSSRRPDQRAKSAARHSPLLELPHGLRRRSVFSRPPRGDRRSHCASPATTIGCQPPPPRGRRGSRRLRSHQGTLCQLLRE